MVLDLASAGVWVERFVADVDRSADDLGELDRLSGDGDFGVNVRAALHRARDTLRGGDQSRVGDVFAALASSFLAAGGTSGPLFGTWFGALSRATASPTIGLVDAAQREVAMDLGVAQAAAAAREGAAATARLIVRRGRASYLGETAARVADPGAVTVALFFEAGAVAVGVGAP